MSVLILSIPIFKTSRITASITEALTMLLFLVLGPHMAILKGYSCLCIQELLMAVFKRPYRRLGGKLGQLHERQMTYLVFYRFGP